MDKNATGPRGDPPGDGRTPLPGGAHFARQFVSGDLATRTVLADLVAGLAGAGLRDDDLSTVELILAEALNNVAEHAYCDAPGPVKLNIELRPSALACRIADQGRPMPNGDVPNPPLPVIEPPDTLPEGGFGWHIIRGLTRDLTYRRCAGWNTLTMTVPLGEGR